MEVEVLILVIIIGSLFLKEIPLKTNDLNFNSFLSVVLLIVIFVFFKNIHDGITIKDFMIYLLNMDLIAIIEILLYACTIKLIISTLINMLKEFLIWIKETIIEDLILEKLLRKD